jgi:hypothetical protein
LARQLAPLAATNAVEVTLHVVVRLASRAMPGLVLGGPDVAAIVAVPGVVV